MKRGKIFRSLSGKFLRLMWDSPVDRNVIFLTAVDANKGHKSVCVALDVSQVDQLCEELAAWSHVKKVEAAFKRIERAVR